jgi:hypothetical protein
MWNAWKRRHVQGFCSNTKEIDGLEDLNIYVGDSVWNGCICLWLGTSGGLLGNWWWNLRVPKMSGICWLTKDVLLYQGLCSNIYLIHPSSPHWLPLTLYWREGIRTVCIIYNRYVDPMEALFFWGGGVHCITKYSSYKKSQIQHIVFWFACS